MSWAICKGCKREMAPGVSCLVGNFRGEPPRIRYAPADGSKRNCHDCNCPAGGLHHPGCDMAICPVCGGQEAFCDCVTPN